MKDLKKQKLTGKLRNPALPKAREAPGGLAPSLNSGEWISRRILGES